MTTDESRDLFAEVQEGESGPGRALPDPHRGAAREVALAYARGALSVGPQIVINQWLPRAAIRSLALRRLRAIVAHAQKSVPLYRRLYTAAGIRAADVTHERAVQRLPFLTKEQLRDQGEALLQPPTARRPYLLRRGSSGSTGMPTVVYFDPLRELPRRLQEFRFLSAHGLRPWHSQLIFDHYDHMVPGKFLPQKLGLGRRAVFPWWLPTERALQYIEHSKPDVFHGILASLRMLALAVRAAGGMRHKPRFVVSKGELVDPATRRLIEETFEARLVDYYATEETGIIAWQCPAGSGYHVDQDLVYVETVLEDGRPARDGELGELVLTNLYMKTMPIIRYRVGDLGRMTHEACPCGRGLPRLQQLHGRKTDLIVTPEGEIHHPFALLAIVGEMEEIAQYRLEQTAVDRLRAHVRWRSSVPASNKHALAAVLARGLADLLRGVTVEVREVEDFDQRFDSKFPLVKGLPGVKLEGITSTSHRIRF